MYYTYVHRRADDNLIFYVGKGNKKRAWSLNRRNAYWKNTANKHKYIVEIWNFFEKEQDAFDNEKQIIEVLRGFMPLTNLTNGGEGSSGLIIPEHVKLKMSKAKKGVAKTAQHRLNIGLALKGRKFSEEHKAKIRESVKETKRAKPRPVTRLPKEVNRNEPNKATHGTIYGYGVG